MRRGTLSALGIGSDVPDTVDAFERNRQRWTFTPPPRREDADRPA